MSNHISVVIPVYNEVSVIAELLDSLLSLKKSGYINEVIVVDGGSTDATVDTAQRYDVRVIVSEHPGRAAQMNLGAKEATGDILYFIHADSLPAENTYEKIVAAITSGYVAGTSVVVFDSAHWSFKLSTLMSKLHTTSARFGDQGLFITKKIFMSIGGFDVSLQLFEDQEIFKRIVKKGDYTVLDTTIVTSARRFERKGIYKVHAVYYVLNTLYRFGVPQNILKKLYTAVL